MTPRLRLRKVDENDLQLLVRWSNSDGAYGEYLTPERLDDRQGRASYESGALWNEEHKLFLIELREGWRPIGTLHYWLRPEKKSCAVMALKISEGALRNKGYGTEAQKYAIVQLFSRLKLERVDMYTDINNGAQQRCLRKLGFELVESLCYDDREIKRVGHLYRIEARSFAATPMYHYHYES